MNGIIVWVTDNWVALVAALWLVEKALTAVSELTPWKWDDNIAKILTKVLKSFFPEKK